MASPSRPMTFLLSLGLLVTGCGAPSASVNLAPAATRSAVGLAAPSPSSTLAHDSATSLPPTAIPARSPSARPITTGAVAVTVVDALRVRSKPRISEDSYKQEPLLPLGTQLYVIDGPISASGYAWFEILPLRSRAIPVGWVAAGSRDGHTWLAVDEFDCPSKPVDFRTLAALPAGVGLACFPRVALTVEARVVSCNCDVDGGWFEPSWFSFGGGPLLVDPAQTKAPSDVADWFPIHMDPDGHHDDVLPVDGVHPDLGQIVEVTGVFDHPAAGTCRYAEMGGELAPSQDCRSMFAVTRLTVVRG